MFKACRYRSVAPFFELITDDNFPIVRYCFKWNKAYFTVELYSRCIFMSISGIGSVSQSWSLQSTSSTTESTSTSAISSLGQNDKGNVSSFIDDVMKSLKALGFNIPDKGDDNSSSSSSISISIINININSSEQAGSSAGTALHALIHDLFQALSPSGSQSANNEINDNSGLGTSNAINGYNNFTSNLQNLIGSFNSSDGSNSSNSILENDFSNLIRAVGHSSATDHPSLQDFLKALLSNTSGSDGSQMGLGSLISTQT